MFDTSESSVMLLTHNVVSNSTIGTLAGNYIFWAVLNYEQMSNKAGVEHQPDCIFQGITLFSRQSVPKNMYIILGRITYPTASQF